MLYYFYCNFTSEFYIGERRKILSKKLSSITLSLHFIYPLHVWYISYSLAKSLRGRVWGLQTSKPMLLCNNSVVCLGINNNNDDFSVITKWPIRNSYPNFIYTGIVTSYIINIIDIIKSINYVASVHSLFFPFMIFFLCFIYLFFCTIKPFFRDEIRCN